MKRIVQCPKCESKLAVFDIGKPITQKCPRCGHAFEISSEEKQGAAASKPAEKKRSKKITAPVTATSAEAPSTEPAAPAPDAPKPAPESAQAPAPDAPTPAPESAQAAADTVAPKAEEAAAPEKAAEKPALSETPSPAASSDKKEITLKKPFNRPVSTASRPAAPSPAATETPAPLPVDHGVTFLHIMVLALLVIVTIIGLLITNYQTKRRLTRIEDAIRFLQTHKK